MGDEAVLNIDFEKISQELKVRPEILKKLVVSFTNSLPQKIQTLGDAFTQNDVLKMRAILHELKGTSGNFRLETVANAVITMHTAVKAGEDPQKIKEYFEILKIKVEELRQYIAKQGS